MKSTALALFLSLSLAPLVTACGTDATSDPEPEPPAGPTYWQDVEPIFATNCVTCHTAGEIGP
jgi:mono/diheme cytochrome c family protein